MMRALARTAWPWTALSAATLVGIWLYASWGGLVSPLFLPSPEGVWQGFLELVEAGYNGIPLGWSIEVSLLRVFVGFGAGAVAGTLIGLAMGLWKGFDSAVEPYVEFLRPLPQLGYLVLLIIWFGIGELSKVMLLFLTALPVAAVAARDGVRGAPLQRILAARSLGANSRQIFRYVILPGALSEIFVGMRLALGLVYATLIAAEMLAGADGIGFMVFNAGRFLRADFVFVGVIIIGIMGVMLDWALVFAERRIVHWAGR